MKIKVLKDVEKGIVFGMHKVRIRGPYIAIELKMPPSIVYTILHNYSSFESECSFTKIIW